MKFDRTFTLNSFKFFSLICSIFLVTVMLNVTFNNNYTFNLELSLNNLEKENKNESKICENKHFNRNKIHIENISEIKNNKKILPTNLDYLLMMTENKYVYYSFALVLGGVINMKKIMKTGIY